ncbi:MAG TPA: hypothetical protein VF228_26520 [Iamia sp.]
MTSERDLLDGLRRAAEQLDAATAPTDVASVVGRRSPASPRPARAGLAAAAVVVLLAGVVAVLALGRGDDESVRVDTPPSSVTSEAPEPSTPTSTPIEPTPPSDSTPATGPVVPPSYEGVPWDQLPAAGRAVVDDERITLVDEAGTELGSFLHAELPLFGSVEEARLLIQPGLAIEVVSDIVEVDGCRVTGASGARIGACGPEQGTLARLYPDGQTVPLVEDPLTPEDTGRWRSGQLSPDGRWVLAQWSGECEVPVAFLVPTDGGPVRTADGLTGWGGDGGPWPANSGAIGWTDDGRAIVSFPESPACGSGDEGPGTYLIDPDTGERTPSDVGGPFGYVLWERAGNENERERAFGRAATELGVEMCCGEPAHGRGGVTSGVVWDGIDVFVGGGDIGPVTIDPGEGELGDVETGDVDGLPVVTGSLSGRPFLAFTCGDTRWMLGGAPVFEGSPPTDAVLRDLASALIPRLYCTVGDPPAVEEA